MTFLKDSSVTGLRQQSGWWRMKHDANINIGIYGDFDGDLFPSENQQGWLIGRPVWLVVRSEGRRKNHKK
jgi:hypothetical protein